ncbi:hypothetical protein EJ07DRAFT_153981 [Lizonia empirigonia]|nr:hypothetical protein EJ07DRAFT_153981 [Lizonia empirigonia]
MRFIATTTFLCATLALATPAPLAGPAVPETVPEFRPALTARAAAALPQLDARASKPKGSKGGSSNSSAAVSVTPSVLTVSSTASASDRKRKVLCCNDDTATTVLIGRHVKTTSNGASTSEAVASDRIVLGPRSDDLSLRYASMEPSIWKLLVFAALYQAQPGVVQTTTITEIPASSMQILGLYPNATNPSLIIWFVKARRCLTTITVVRTD